MTGTEPGSASSVPEPRRRAGLELRIWLGCLGGVVVCGAGLLWAFADPSSTLDPALFRMRVLAGLGAGAFTAVLLAIWLDRGIVARVRHLLHSLSTASDRRRPCPLAR